MNPHVQSQHLTSVCLCFFNVNECLFVFLQDSILFIEQHKSGFERPADVEFEDYTQGIKPATSDSSLNPPKVRAKLWPFSKRHKVNLHTLDFVKLAYNVKRSKDEISTASPFSASHAFHLTTWKSSLSCSSNMTQLIRVNKLSG